MNLTEEGGEGGRDVGQATSACEKCRRTSKVGASGVRFSRVRVIWQQNPRLVLCEATAVVMKVKPECVVLQPSGGAAYAVPSVTPQAQPVAHAA